MDKAYWQLIATERQLWFKLPGFGKGSYHEWWTKNMLKCSADQRTHYIKSILTLASEVLEEPDET